MAKDSKMTGTAPNTGTSDFPRRCGGGLTEGSSARGSRADVDVPTSKGSPTVKMEK